MILAIRSTNLPRSHGSHPLPNAFETLFEWAIPPHESPRGVTTAIYTPVCILELATSRRFSPPGAIRTVDTDVGISRLPTPHFNICLDGWPLNDYSVVSFPS
jgi:hypothetical protein